MSKKQAKETAIQIAPASELLAMMAQDAGAGMEGADRESYAIPFLRILQTTSPQCVQGPQKRDGAEPGMFLNSVTEELFSGEQGLVFIPCAFQRRWIRWAPRGADSGFRGELLTEEVAAMRADGRVVDIDGHLYVADENGKASEKKSDRLSDTRSHFGLLLAEDGSTAQILLSLSSTQIKKSKQLMSILSMPKVKVSGGKMVTPPTWMNKVRLTTALESNDQGSWYGFRIEYLGFIDDPDLYAAGAAFHEAIARGTVQVAHGESSGAPDERF